MWFRAVLLFIFWLLVFQLLFQGLRLLLRINSRRRGGDGQPSAGKPSDARADGRRVPWQPTDVIDVPFREAPAGPAGLRAAPEQVARDAAPASAGRAAPPASATRTVPRRRESPEPDGEAGPGEAPGPPS